MQYSACVYETNGSVNLSRKARPQSSIGLQQRSRVCPGQLWSLRGSLKLCRGELAFHGLTNLRLSPRPPFSGGTVLERTTREVRRDWTSSSRSVPTPSKCLKRRSDTKCGSGVVTGQVRSYIHTIRKVLAWIIRRQRLRKLCYILWHNCFVNIILI